jgi:hypothetical protein
LAGNIKGRDHLGELGLDERIILKFILENRLSSSWTESNWLGIRLNDNLM